MAWTRGPTIGRGSSAVVSLATGAGDVFAVKSTDLSSSALLQKEENLISQLCSPYVVKCLGSDITREDGRRFYNLFLEYLPGGTLSDQIREQGGALGEAAIRLHARQILLGLSYLHQKGLAHCDVKGQNILVGGGDGLRLKIADFGCAKWVERGGPATFSGTPAYMAPEVARGEEQGFAADVWAFGCTVIEMATGSGPWPEMRDPAAALYRIGFTGDVPETPHWFSDGAKDMLAKCLMKDPRERWTVCQLLEHPFFESIDGESKIGEIRKTPTSVMDQGFWDALEASDFSGDPTEFDSDPGSDLDTPAGRVGSLIGPDLNFSGWAEEEEEGWFTVRGDENDEECPKLDENDWDLTRDHGDSIDAETVNFWIVDGEESFRASVSMEDFEMDCFDGNSSSSSTFPVTHSESVINDFYLVGIVKSENYVNGISSSRSTFSTSILAFSWYNLLVPYGLFYFSIIFSGP